MLVQLSINYSFCFAFVIWCYLKLLWQSYQFFLELIQRCINLCNRVFVHPEWQALSILDWWLLGWHGSERWASLFPDLQDVMMFPGWMRLVGICGIRSLDQVCDCIIDCNILQWNSGRSKVGTISSDHKHCTSSICIENNHFVVYFTKIESWFNIHQS